jgi:hypothetical protein
MTPLVQSLVSMYDMFHLLYVKDDWSRATMLAWYPQGVGLDMNQDIYLDKNHLYPLSIVFDQPQDLP